MQSFGINRHHRLPVRPRSHLVASKCNTAPVLTLLDACLAAVQKINPVIRLWDDVLYYWENVQDVLLGEHRSVLGIKLILSDKKLYSGYL